MDLLKYFLFTIRLFAEFQMTEYGDIANTDSAAAMFTLVVD